MRCGAPSLAPHRDALRIAQLVRPAPQPGPCSSLSAAARPHRWRSGRALPLRPAGAGRAARGRCPPESLERSQFACGPPIGRSRTSRSGRARRAPAAPAPRPGSGSRDLDRQVKRVPEATRARVVGLGSIRRRVEAPSGLTSSAPAPSSADHAANRRRSAGHPSPSSSASGRHTAARPSPRVRQPLGSGQRGGAKQQQLLGAARWRW